jgi:homocysteine S-methyltransferase
MTNVQHGKYRGCLPQLDGGLFLTDGGLETTLIFHEGFELPMFAAFTLVESERGRAALRAYYDRYVSMALRDGNGLILESPTWRANPDWGAKLGYGRDRLLPALLCAPTTRRTMLGRLACSKTPAPISSRPSP